MVLKATASPGLVIDVRFGTHAWDIMDTIGYRALKYKLSNLIFEVHWKILFKDTNRKVKTKFFIDYIDYIFGTIGIF